MGQRKKVSEDRSSLEMDMYVNLEIDIQALRGKNKQLVQNIAKIQQEKTHLQKQITSLQKDYFELNSKHVNLKNVFLTIDSTVKVCFPKMAEVVNDLGKVMHLCSIGSAVSCSNKDPQTLAVMPHRVNDTLIKHPIINLSRTDLTESQSTNSQLSSHSLAPCMNKPPSVSSRYVDQNDILDNVPSTSRYFDDNHVVNENRDEDFIDIDNSLEVDSDQQSGFHLSGGNDELRMVTIEEDDQGEYEALNHSAGTIENRIREIRIYLSPLGAEYMNKRKSESSFMGRSSSLSGEASSFLLNTSDFNETSKDSNKTMDYSNCDLETSDCLSSNRKDWNNVQIRKKSQQFISSNSFEPNLSSICYSNSTAGNDRNPCSSNSTCDFIQNSKMDLITKLGLTPGKSSSLLTTSTPIGNSPRYSKRISNMSHSGDNSNISSPVMSNINRRKRSNESKLPSVIVNRLNLDKSSDPAKKINEVLNTTPITSSADIKVKEKSEKEVSFESDPKLEQINTKNKRQKLKKGKENQKQQVSSLQITESPRPKRSARPIVLKERSLKKKMRRSK